MSAKFKFVVFITALFFLRPAFSAPEFSKGPGLLFLVGSSAKFSDSNKWVQVSKHQEKNNKLMIYAHGGVGVN